MKNFRIIDGQIFAGSAPSLKDLEYLKNILNIKTVLSLDSNVAKKISPYLKSNNIKHFVIPIDASKSYMDQNVRNLMKNLTQILDNNQPIFFHCLHGQDRTSFIEGIYRIKKQNWNSKKVLSEINKYNFGAGVSKNVKNFWINILMLLDNNNSNDISFIEDHVIQDLRNNYRIYNDITYSGWNRGMLGQAQPQIPLQKTPNLKNNLKQYIPNIGISYGLGPTQGYGPIENNTILPLVQNVEKTSF